MSQDGIEQNTTAREDGQPSPNADAAPARGQDEHSEREHFFGAAKIMAGLTVLSRLLGLVRDITIWRFGATGKTDAFWMAFSIPNLFRRLFGEGALSAAFIPVFTEVAEADGWDRARVMLANAAGVLAALLAGLTVLGELGLGAWLLFGPPGGDATLSIRLTMLVLPFMFTVCLLALGSAALQCKGRFAYPAFAPILLNISLISAAIVAWWWLPGRTEASLYVLSAAVLIAGAVQLVGVVWLLRRVQLAAMPNVRPVLGEVRKVALLTLPMMVPLGILQFSAFFDRFYAFVISQQAGGIEFFGWNLGRPLEEGVVTWLYAANRLYQFPLGILAISLATAVFPLFSRYARRGNIEGLRDATNRALRLSLFMGIPSGVGLILLAGPIIALVARRGNFSRESVAGTVPILQAYCLGMWAYFCNHILLRAFFSQKDTKTPLRISCALAGLNMLLVATLVFTPLGAAAIGLATALTAATNVLLLIWVLRRRWGRIGFRRIAVSLLRTGLATIAMGAAIIALEAWLFPAVKNAIGTGTVSLMIRVGSGVISGAGVFVLTSIILRGPELRELIGSLRKRKPDPPAPEPAENAEESA
ncbi:MAG: murein biosynthesis integral membrane protein MurJ [Phycisphaerae bacterium]